MNKFISVVLFALLSVAHAKVSDVTYASKNSLARTDDYIGMSNVQFNNVLNGFNTKLQAFQENYNRRLETVIINRKFISDAVVNFNQKLNPLEFLNTYAKFCVSKYRNNTPNVQEAQIDVTNCHNDYSSKLTTLLTESVNTRNLLAGYIVTYNQELEKCGNHQEKSSITVGSDCWINVTDKYNIFINKAVENFQTQMETLACIANGYIKSAIYCAFSAVKRTVSLLAVTDSQIQSCLLKKGDCEPCEEFTCSESHILRINPSNKTILNPFFGRSDYPQCIMLNGSFEKPVIN